MSHRELRDLTLSALVLALAFGIALSGGINALREPLRLALVSLMALVGVSSGFVLHELGHRYVARRLGSFAEYVMWPKGLLMALGFSLFGFVFAAPGAVTIHRGEGPGSRALTKETTGIISIAGPAFNIVLASVFLFLNAAYPALVFSLAAIVNSWLAIFNLIPFGPLDGAKIFSWNKLAWSGALGAAIALFSTQYWLL